MPFLKIEKKYGFENDGWAFRQQPHPPHPAHAGEGRLSTLEGVWVAEKS